MSILDSLPSIIAGALSDTFRDATLTRVSNSTSDGRGGYVQVTVTDACKALVLDYSAFQRGQLGIPTSERKIMILAATLNSGMAPKPGDRLTIAGREWSIIEVTSDPANATYECRGK